MLCSSQYLEIIPKKQSIDGWSTKTLYMSLFPRKLFWSKIGRIWLMTAVCWTNLIPYGSKHNFVVAGKKLFVHNLKRSVNLLRSGGWQFKIIFEGSDFLRPWRWLSRRWSRCCQWVDPQERNHRRNLLYLPGTMGRPLQQWRHIWFTILLFSTKV